MSDSSTNLQLPYLMPAQAQKHVTINETIRRLDAFVQPVAKSKSLSVQPSSPQDGSLYILPGQKSGSVWGSYPAKGLAYYRDGGWEIFYPKTGWQVYVVDEKCLCVYEGKDWQTLSSLP